MTTLKNSAAEELVQSWQHEYRITLADKRAMVEDLLAAERRQAALDLLDRLEVGFMNNPKNHAWVILQEREKLN